MYLSGAKNKIMADDLAEGRIGLLQTPNTAYNLDGVAVWAMDNGCYANTYPGDDAYLATLDKYAAHREACLFVAAPDVVGDKDATLDLFPTMAARIKGRGWPVALVAQDGLTPDEVPWFDIDWLFIGGSDTFKLGPDAETLIAVARERGVHVHVGRVNSATRFRHFRALGCDTADGTFVAYAPDVNVPKVRRWINDHTYLLLWDAVYQRDEWAALEGRVDE